MAAPTRDAADSSGVGHRKTRDEIAKAYKSEPWWYDVRGFFILTFAYNSTLGAIMRQFGPNIGPRHIEIAIGSGTLLQMILKWRRRRKLPHGEIVGIDYAESMLAGAMRRFAGHPEIDLQLADAAALPLEADSFDTANIANSLHCFPDVDGALREVARVLKPGGTFAANVLLFPRGGWPLRNIAQRINDWGIAKGILYSPLELDDIRQRVLNTGLQIVSENVSGNCYNVLARKPQTAAP
jgi:ubiquinone/menaquinone biosynthesis C-methylase UbiE